MTIKAIFWWPNQCVLLYCYSDWLCICYHLCKVMNRNWLSNSPDSVPAAKPFPFISPGCDCHAYVVELRLTSNLVTGELLLTDWLRFCRHRFSACLKVSGQLLSFSIRFSAPFGLHGGTCRAPSCDQSIWCDHAGQSGSLSGLGMRFTEAATKNEPRLAKA